jgi:hypothetical protein
MSNIILDACRAPSGKHFLDSGGDDGRHWQKPAIDKDHAVVSWDPRFKDATLHTGPFLVEWAGDDLMTLPMIFKNSLTNTLKNIPTCVGLNSRTNSCGMN